MSHVASTSLQIGHHPTVSGVNFTASQKPSTEVNSCELEKYSKTVRLRCMSVWPARKNPKTDSQFTSKKNHADRELARLTRRRRGASLSLTRMLTRSPML